jgi:hypothetical protein
MLQHLDTAKYYRFKADLSQEMSSYNKTAKRHRSAKPINYYKKHFEKLHEWK